MDILRAALALVSGLKGEVSDDNCNKSGTVHTILGHSGSRPTIAFAQVVGRFHIPVVSNRGMVIAVNAKYFFLFELSVWLEISRL